MTIDPVTSTTSILL